MKSEVVIGKYIRQLLAEGKRVILPGFGNLQIKEVSGEVPPSGGRINPPGPSVKFDEKYSKDDGLLASAYATGEDMDPGEAEQHVLELVDAIRFALDKGENYILPDTGTFSRDDEGKTHFKTDPGWVLEPDQFGLDSMDLLELDELAPEETGPTGEESAGTEVPGDAPAGEVPLEEPVGEPGMHADEPEEPQRAEVPFTPSWMTPEPPVKIKRRSGRWRVIWIITASLILILLVLIFVPVNRTEDGSFHFGKGSILLKNKKEAPAVQPAVTPTEESAISASGEESASGDAQAAGAETAMESASSEEGSNRTAGSDNYFIIAGSFRHLQNASELQDRLRGMGYPAEIMITDSRMYRVSVASYANKNEALRRLEGLKSEPDLQNCWLLAR